MDISRKVNPQLKALSSVRQSLKPSGFLTKIYIVAESLNLMIFQISITVYPDSESFHLREFSLQRVFSK
jgi:hypothetical protein